MNFAAKFLGLKKSCNCLKQQSNECYPHVEFIGNKNETESKKPNKKKQLLFYRTNYWMNAFKKDNACSCYRNDDIIRQNLDENLKSFHYSPVRIRNPGSKLYAYERLGEKDFHIPRFRTSQLKNSFSNRSLDYQIESYFNYLKQFCDNEVFRLNEKNVQCLISDKVSTIDLNSVYNRVSHEIKLLDETYESLQKALNEINVLISKMSA